jgi:hypothetical protein
MATVPRRGNFTRRKRRFSYVGKYDPSARPRVYGDETDDYSSAEEVDIDDVDHPKILLEAREEEENRAIAEKAARKSLEDEAKRKVLAVARAVANTISPGKKVTIKLKRRGESGGGSGRTKKHTKKQVKGDRKHKQNKHTKRQPKCRD